MAKPSTPTPRRALPSTAAAHPLSAASLSRIQARTRFPSLAAHSARHSPSRPRCDSPASRALSEEFVAPYLGRLIISAHDEIATCPEMGAVWAWVDAVRRAARRAVRPQDVDLRNGVALLDVIAEVWARESAAPAVAAPEMEMDEEGAVGRRNVGRVCEALRGYPWGSVGGGGKVRAVRFEVLDPWALGGFVLLAAVTCEDSGWFLESVERLDDEVQGLIDGLVRRAMDALGICLEDVWGGGGAVAVAAGGGVEEEVGAIVAVEGEGARAVGGAVVAVAVEKEEEQEWVAEAAGGCAAAEVEILSAASRDTEAGTDPAAEGGSSPSAGSSSVSSGPPASPAPPSRRSMRSWEAEVCVLRRKLAVSEARAEAAERRAAREGGGGSGGGRAEMAQLRRRCLEAERRVELLERQLGGCGGGGSGRGRRG